MLGLFVSCPQRLPASWWWKHLALFAVWWVLEQSWMSHVTSLLICLQASEAGPTPGLRDLGLHRTYQPMKAAYFHGVLGDPTAK